MATTPNPDPAKGVFETMLVANGRPVELDAHMARLGNSLRELYGEGVALDVERPAREKARGIGLGRLKLTVAPEGHGGIAIDALAVEVDPVLVFPSWAEAVGLHSLVVEGGLGPHKWADRTLLGDAEAGMPAGAVPLLLDSDGAVLEAARANLFAVRGEAIFTPPADGRILPGIARRTAIEVAGEEGIRVREAELRIDDLLQADEVFLTGSVRGIEPVGSIDGAELSSTAWLSGRIAAALRQRWLG